MNRIMVRNIDFLAHSIHSKMPEVVKTQVTIQQINKIEIQRHLGTLGRFQTILFRYVFSVLSSLEVVPWVLSIRRATQKKSQKIMFNFT